MEHKRSKSAIAKSLLQRVSSRQDDSRAESETTSPLSATPSNTSINLPVSSEYHSKRLSHQQSPTTATMPSVGSPQSPPSNPSASIEQSVRLFRVFEALRSGDQATIAKAIKEHTAGEKDEDVMGPRPDAASILHLAIQCAEIHVIEHLLQHYVGPGTESEWDINARDHDGNTPLHIAATLGRAPVVNLLLERPDINDSVLNHSGQAPLDLARSPEIFQQLQLFRSLLIDAASKRLRDLVAAGDYEGIEAMFAEPRIKSTLDVNSEDLATDPATVETGGTLLHQAARKKDIKLIQVLLLNGADPFRRDRKGKLPQSVTSDDKTKSILKKSPAAAAAQRGIQEKTILGGSAGQGPGGPTIESVLGSKEAREMKGYLKKWTNYTSGWKLRWFVLEDGVLSYYKHQDDTGSACRGAINMRIAKLHMDPQDKLRFEIQGKSSVKYHLRANHQVEAKRWYWALNNAIQWSKDEAREEEKRLKEPDTIRYPLPRPSRELDISSVHSSRAGARPSTSNLALPVASSKASTTAGEEEEALGSVQAPSVSGGEVLRPTPSLTRIDSADDDEYPDDTSSQDVRYQNRDAFNITAQSAKLHLDLLAQVSTALQNERSDKPDTPLSDQVVGQGLASYDAAVGNLRSLIGDLLRIGRDREAYWHYRLEREANVRRMWEESMARVAKEQEELENKIGQSEDKRKRTKRALRDALGGLSSPQTPQIRDSEFFELEDLPKADADGAAKTATAAISRRATLAQLDVLSESESDEEEEFFDAIGSGEVEVVVSPAQKHAEPATTVVSYDQFLADLQPSFKGYEDPIRKRLAMDADDRPKISLWGILKSMIGKDMTKMTLPVSFNEPTSLLQRVAEDMEYTDLLDTAADCDDPTERMVYVAAFAASEYASTIGRVAKPFNPLLGETFEYARPDKGYRFFIEQVSHHPPIGAAYADSPKWDYWGESAVKSKFYGRSFDVNPLGTWFLRLRPRTGGSELYTWKKVTSSVVGIITGNPTVDNYGPMQIKNWTTGEECTLDFKARGWKASSAYQVSGKVLDRHGRPRWTVAGRWNDKIYARPTTTHDTDDNDEVAAGGVRPTSSQSSGGGAPAFLVWQCNPRPTGIPFNLTPFVVTLNALPDRLRPHLAPTDTRLRPDQRAMEDGAYDFAATEKNRLEEKQRATRRRREAAGEEFVPRWFTKGRCDVTGEEYWVFNGEYWTARAEGRWEGLEDIF